MIVLQSQINEEVCVTFLCNGIMQSLDLSLKINIKIYFNLILFVFFHLLLVMLNRFLYQIYIFMLFASSRKVLKGGGGDGLNFQDWGGGLNMFKTAASSSWEYFCWVDTTQLHAIFSYLNIVVMIYIFIFDSDHREFYNYQFSGSYEQKIYVD